MIHVTDEPQGKDVAASESVLQVEPSLMFTGSRHTADAHLELLSKRKGSTDASSGAAHNNKNN